MTNAMPIPGSVRKKIDAEFGRYIACIHSGRKPYQWQYRLLGSIIDHGRWPDRLEAPTGAGKTVVIDIHVFLNALAGLATRSGNEWHELLSGTELDCLPRRLVMTVNRRTLVDDQYEEALALSAKLDDAFADKDDDPVLRNIRQGLLLREFSDGGDPDEASHRHALRVTRLRGGEAIDDTTREWRYHPTECQILCATPDMFGSRLLFHGYGTRAAARPIEAGMLAYDTVLVADEAHLNRQLVVTAKSVARLEKLCNSPLMESRPVLQVVSTTATQDGSFADDIRIGVEEADFEADSALAARMLKPKPVHLVSGGETDKDVVATLVKQCMKAIEFEEKRDDERGVVGCIVNTVKTATAVLKALRKEYARRNGAGERGKSQTETDAGEASDSNTPIRGFIGPMRQYDKNQMVHGQIFDALKGNPDAIRETGLRCVVATQTMEVGVDVDFASLITELPSGSALVQRAGRVNRRGLREQGDITVVTRKIDADQTAPYRAEDVEEALHWLQQLGKDAEGLSAWRCAQHPPKPAIPTRLLWQRPEIWDIENLSHTDEDLAADMGLANQGRAGLDLWLRDDLSPANGPDIGLVVRDLPADDVAAIELLQDVPPVADESFPLMWGNIDDIGKRLSPGDAKSRIFIMKPKRRGAESSITHWDGSEKLTDSLQAGDMLIVDSTAPLFDADMHIVSLDAAEQEKDVYNLCQSTGVVISANPEADPTTEALYDAIVEIRKKDQGGDETSGVQEDSSSDPADGNTNTDVLILNKWPKEEEKCPEVQEIMRERHKRFVEAFGDEGEKNKGVLPTVYPGVETFDSQEVWLVLKPVSALSDGRDMQELHVSKDFKKARETVLLDDEKRGHQPAVKRRVEQFVSVLGLPEGMIADLKTAARHHDDGKKDFRFQMMLRLLSGTEKKPYLAKSGIRSPKREARIRRALNLQGWRHEQRSAAECWAQGEKLQANDIELVTRLAGTSHGHGRSCFRDDADTLIPLAVRNRDDEQKQKPPIGTVYESARQLFDEGIWERIVENTDIRYGYWGMAYLEAILRSADITVSKEGN